MASVNEEKSEARQKLDLALGLARVSLARLSPVEFDDLLCHALSEIDFRELRGFVSLKDFLTWRSDADDAWRNGICQLDPQANLSPIIFPSSFALEEARGLSVHVQSAVRDLVIVNRVFKRDESGEETSDMGVVKTWGETAYLLRAQCEILVLRRPRNHTSGAENLARLKFDAEKVAHENRFEVSSAWLEQLKVGSFRAYYGSRYPEMALSLIWQLRDICSRTHHVLRQQTEFFAEKEKELYRLGAAITA